MSSPVQSLEVHCSVVLRSAVKYSAVHIRSVQCSAMQYGAVQYNAVQCSAAKPSGDDNTDYRLLLQGILAKG